MIGETIKEARIEKRLTQQQLGLLMGYSEQSAELMVQHWEHGRRELPRKKIRLLSEILGIPIDKLVP